MSFQQPQHQPPSQQPRRKQLYEKPWVWVALVVIGVPALLVATLADDSKESATAPSSSTASVATSSAGLPSAAIASAEAAAGIPPLPDAAAQNAYIYALEQVDPEIVRNKPEATVSRGRDQCSSIKQYPRDRAKLIELTQVRFTAPGHPRGFGPEVSAQILDIVHQHLCPTY